MAAGLSSRPIALLPPAQSTCSDVPVNVRIFFGNIWGYIFLLRPAQSSCFTVQVNVGIFFKNAFFLRPAQSTCFTIQVKVGIFFQEYLANIFSPPSCTVCLAYNKLL